MFKTLRDRLFLALLCVAAAPAVVWGLEPRAPPKIDFPESLAALEFIDRTTYDSPELGYSVRYEGLGGLKVDVYVYDLGLADLGSGQVGPAVRKHFQMVIGDVFNMEQRGRYRDVRLLREEEQTLATAGGSLPLLHATFRYAEVRRSDDREILRPVESHLLLLTYRDHFLKVRCTYAAADSDYGVAKLDRFLQALGHLLH